MHLWLGILGLVAAFFTVCYAFRVWFRVFCGPTEYEMGDEEHEDVDADPYETEKHDDHADGHGDHHHHHAPHEMPWIPMNGPLVFLAMGALFAGWLGMGYDDSKHGWIGGMIEHSSANPEGWTPPIQLEQPDIPGMAFGPGPAEMPMRHSPLASKKVYVLGMDLHWFMFLVSALIAGGGIALAWYLHLKNRNAAAKLRERAGPLATVLYHKYYIDEFYHAMFVMPLRAISWLFFYFDALVIDGLIAVIGALPKSVGRMVRPTQSGMLQGYGIGMLLGLAVILLIVMSQLRPWS